MRRIWNWAALAAFAFTGCAPLGTEDRVRILERDAVDMRAQEIRLSLLEEKVRDLEGAMAAMAGPEARPLAGAAPRSVPRPVAPAPAKSSSAPAASASPKAARPASAEQSAYNSALALYEAHKYTEAATAFTEFMQAYPASSLMPNAFYWLGECRYGERRYDEAILTFKNGVSRFPGHAKAADCMLKIGFSYEKLGDRDNAAFYYEALVEDYPRTRAASLARQKLART